MGKTTIYLLVKLLISYLLISTICLAKVNITQHDEFWLWSGVKTQPVLEKASTIYLLRGQIVSNYNNHSHLINQRSPILPRPKQQLWLVYRAHTLNWDYSVLNGLTKELKYWQSNDIPIKGIQIDFDVSTHKLSDYIQFLQKIRTWLPKEYQLSITGLLDWGSNSNPSLINQLAESVDEVVFQTYQGKKTIKNYQKYLEKLQGIKLPFKIGIIQNGQWQPSKSLEQSPFFKGYVIFLQNESSFME